MAGARRRRGDASVIIRSAIEAGQKSLLEFEAERVARQYGIRVAKSGLARSEREAGLLAKRMGFPLAMKIVSKDILHKSDIGGVRTNVGSLKEVRGAYARILKNAEAKNPRADIAGVLVQRMAPEGQEFVVGATRDPQFGPAVMFGFGGVYVELFKDVSFRLAPITNEEATDMMKETRAYKLLTGFRGSKPLDALAVAKTIVAVGRLMVEQPAVDSIDINPLFVYSRGTLAVDVRVVVRNAERKPPIAEVRAH